MRRAKTTTMHGPAVSRCSRAIQVIYRLMITPVVASHDERVEHNKPIYTLRVIQTPLPFLPPQGKDVARMFHWGGGERRAEGRERGKGSVDG